MWDIYNALGEFSSSDIRSLFLSGELYNGVCFPSPVTMGYEL